MDDSLSILNADPQQLPGPKLLHYLVANPQVQDPPPAIEYLSPSGSVESITYTQLHARANGLARSIQSRRNSATRDCKTPFVAPIFLPQCPHLYIAQLAALKAAAAFCPISLDVPEERLRFILEDVGANMLLTTSQLRQKLPDLGESVSIIAVDEIQDRIQDVDEAELSVNIDPSAPAYIMYTSGSTGQPKGVIISHLAATQALLAHDRHIPTFARFLNCAHPVFDVSVFEIFFPFFRGCTLVCGDRRLLMSDLAGFINRMAIDAAELTPSVASSLLNGKESVPNLKLLLTIGEMLKYDVIEDFGASDEDGGVLYGMYGPTEATIHCTLQVRFRKDMPAGNIGVPLDTVSCFIIKPRSADQPSGDDVEIVPISDEGELAVGGYQLADGYLNRPEQTEAAFVNHPRHGRLYRTGDRARLTTSGNLECLGRISSGQVKLRGQRIELGEIEYAAAKTPGCKTVVAEVIDNALVVFCVCEVDANTEDIRWTCKSWLPSFMVPTDILLLDELPHLNSGKVDRKALQAMYSERHASNGVNGSNEVNGTMTPHLQALTEILGDVLGITVDLNTQLAAAGLDSLSSIRLASKMRRAGYPQPDAALLLEARTVQELERKLLTPLESSKMSKDTLLDTSTDVLDRVLAHPSIFQRSNEIEDAFETTFVQSAMLSETEKDGQAYCNWVEISVRGYSVERVEGCLTTLARCHSLLRSGFVPIPELHNSYALITWSDLDSSQTRVVAEFDYDFKITNDAGLLRPVHFQLKPQGDEVRISIKLSHALYDQWALDVVKHDLGCLLRGSNIPPRPSFKSVSRFHSAHRAHYSTDQYFELWQDHLRHFTPTPLSVMTGKRQSRKLSRTSWQTVLPDLSSLRTQSRRLGISAPTFFQAALSYVLTCYTGTPDVSYGVVFSGRHLPIEGIEWIFGPCLSTLPVRVDLSGTRTISDLLTLVQGRNRAVQRCALTPMNEIKKNCGFATGAQLFDVLFVWQETSLGSPKDAEAVQEVNSADFHEFNLVLEFEPSESSVQIRATYQEAIFPPQQIEIMIAQVRVLLNHIIETQDGLVESLSRCLPQQLLSASNPSPSSCAGEYDLITSIQDHARKTPNSTALVFATAIEDAVPQVQALTFRELNERANRMAQFLMASGVLPNDLICICMEKCINFYVSVLAVFKIGAGYVPITPDTPESRIKSIIHQAQVKFCLYDGDRLRKIEHLTETTAVDANSLDLRDFSAGNVKLNDSKDHLAYVVFTSGSTGEPKGVAVSMMNLLGNLQALSALYEVEQGDRLLQLCSHAFDVSVFEIFFAFYTGMCLCAGTKDVLFQDLEESIRVLNITHLSLTPTVAALVDPANVSDVRFLVTAGEGVTDLVRRRWAGNGLHQGYGPSETTNICSVNMTMSSGDVLGNVGQPLRNTSAFVISSKPEFELLPAGSVGELAFGGEQVFRGYVGMDSLNIEKIINSPEFGRIYRSGDVGRILSDGTLLMVGRVDDQVKLRGNRVELGDVTATLLRSSLIHDGTVMVIGSQPPEQSLAAFVVPTTGSNIDASGESRLSALSSHDIRSIFEHLESSLAPYMVPTLLVPVTNLPLTSQGKLDRRSLLHLFNSLDGDLKLSLTSQTAHSDESQEWKAAELEIAAALSDVLRIRVQSIGHNESFFALGLDSLNAIGFAKLASTKLHTRIRISTVLQNPSVARLYGSLQRENKALPQNNQGAQQLLPPEILDRAQKASILSEQDIKMILPCMPLQEAMLASSTSSSTSRAAYCNSLSLRIQGDVKRIKQCWDFMMHRHDILRTQFVRTEAPSHPFLQVVAKKLVLPWYEHEASHFDGHDARMQAAAGKETATVHELEPFRIDVYASNLGHTLVIRMLHSLYDGISLTLLLQEIEKHYRGTQLPPVPSFAQLLAEAQTQAGDAALAFWAEQFKEFKPRPFPMLNCETKSSESVVDIDLAITSEEVETYSKRHAVSQLAVFQTAFAKVLACAQEADDICFGNVVSGRTAPVDGVDNLVAPCFNTIPLRANVAGVRCNIELSKRLNRLNLNALAYHLTPLRRIQAVTLSPSQRLFDALLIFQPAAQSLDSAIWTIEGESGSMDIPLVVEVQPVQQSYRMQIHFQPPAIEQTLANSIAQAFSSALRSSLLYPESDIESFESFDQTEVAGRLATEKNITPIPPDTTAPDEDWNYEEQAIRQIFCHLTGISTDRISKSTSMYQIGLDSLNAAQVARQLRSSGIDVDAIDVMETLTPAALGRLAREKPSWKPRGTKVIDLQGFDQLHRTAMLEHYQLKTHSIEAIRPCTSVQNGMLAQTFATKGELYINHVTYRLPIHISLSDLKRAWKIVCGRHTVLRMGFQNISNPETPFAMIIWAAQQGDTSITEYKNDVSLEAIEQEARTCIMENIDRTAWQVSVKTSEQERLFVLSISHAIYDAEGLLLLLEDLAETLSQPVSRPLPSGDLDSILETILTAEADEGGADQYFWRERLVDLSTSKFPDLTSSVVTRGDLRSQTYKCSLTVPEAERFCQREGVTLQALGQTAWSLLLSAYVGDPRVTFGTVFSGASDVVFPNIATIPVSVNTDCSPLEVLRKMVDYNASAQRHRFAPLSKIQRLADLGAKPLFDTVFVYQTTTQKNTEFDWPLIRESAAVDYIVSLELEHDQEGAIRLRLTFNTTCIPPEQAQLMLQQYDFLLTQITSGSHSNGVSEATHAISGALEPSLPTDAHLLHETFENSVLRYPDHTALEFVYGLQNDNATTKTWSYSQLDRIANQIAHLIRQLDVRQDTIVGVCMNKCPQASFAFLGISKAGCAFLTIDPDLPESRFRFILEDASASLLFVDGDNLSKASFVSSGVQCIELTESRLAELPDWPVDSTPVSPSATSYCLYTSGTTGNPKGVEITHDNVVQLLLSFQRLFSGRWTSHSRWLQFASYWFDVSVLEHFWSWSVGITVVGAPRDVVLEDIAGFIQIYNITHIDLTPSLARLVHPDDVPSLCGGVFITGGEALKQEIIDAWGSKATICNGYGPTEATIGVTMNTFIGPDAKPSNIGCQFDNVGAYVLQPDSNQPVLRGAIGELCISGKLVGKGYLNRPDLTTTSFPFLERFGERVYRTGDLVRLLADGCFVFIGRKDLQTKLRGQRLEIREIDVAIKESAGRISDVVSLVIRSKNDKKEMLISFFTLQSLRRTPELFINVSEESGSCVRTARETCVNRLPGYMVPTHIIPINYIPLTVNNKIDSKALKALFVSTSLEQLQTLDDSKDDGGQLSETEQRVCNALQEILQVDITGAVSKSNLFSLGLSSISAISFASLLKRSGFNRAAASTIMQNSTIGQLSNALSSTSTYHEEQDLIDQSQLWIKAFSQRHLPEAAKTLSTAYEKIEVVVPCTPLQQGLIIESLKSDNDMYFNGFQYSLGGVNTILLTKAIDELVASTQVLRTSFIQTEEGFAQVVLHHSYLPLSQWTLQSNDIEGFLLERRQIWLEQNRTDLASPFEAHIVRSPASVTLMIYIHHALYDGISYELLIDRLSDLYRSKCPQNSIPSFIAALPFGPLRLLRGAEPFWKTRLQGCRYAPLQQKEHISDKSDLVMSLNIQDVSSIETARRKFGVSHQALFQSCFEIALHHHSPSTRTYGTVVSGRSIALEGADRVIGPLFNTLPHPLRIVSSSTFSDHIQRCQTLNTDALPFQHTPLRDVRKWIGQHPSEPLFDILFVFQQSVISESDDVPPLLVPVSKASRAEYPLACEVELGNNGTLNVSLLAQPTFFNQRDLDGLLESFKQALDLTMDDGAQLINSAFEVCSDRDTTYEVDVMENLEHMNGVHRFEWTEQAQCIREAISQIAGIDLKNIDEHTSIFTLGLDSIDAVRLASRLSKDNMSIPVSRVLQAQTIPRILAEIQTRHAGSKDAHNHSRMRHLAGQIDATKLAISRRTNVNVEKVLPATPHQEALMADMLQTDLQEYFNHDVLRLHANTDVERLKTAWHEVIQVTPILRTSFSEVDDPQIESVFAQIIDHEGVLRFNEHNLDGSESIECLFDGIRQEVLRDMHNLPPWRLTIVNIHEETYLILSMAHALYDGHSLGLLHQDVYRAYYGALTPRPSNEQAIGSAIAATEGDARDFWTRSLSGSRTRAFPYLTMHADSMRTHRKDRISNLTAVQARSFCQRYGVTIQALAQTSWALTLAHYTQNLEVLYGVVLACRDSEQAEQVLFPTMNTVVMKSSLHGSRSQMLQHMQGKMTDVLPYQRTSLRMIQAACSNAVQRDCRGDGNSLFDTLFVYQQRPRASGDTEESLYESVGGSSDVEYPVAVEMEVVGDQLIIRAACKSSVMDEAATADLLKHIDGVLNCIVESPDEPTVWFSGSNVSVCGMDQFPVPTVTNHRTDHKKDSTDTEAAEPSSNSDLVASITDSLAQISSLPTSAITATTSIESIGVDSISAIKVASLLRKQSIKLSVSDIVKAKTPARMARTVETTETTDDEFKQCAENVIASATVKSDLGHIAQATGIDSSNLEAILPATAGQLYMLSIWRKTNGQLFYPTFQYQLDSKLAVERVKQAWEVLVDRHPILRTIFFATDEIDVPLLQVVLRDAPESFIQDRRPSVKGVAQPMVSLRAIQNETGFLLGVTIHHSLYDAVSLPLLMDDLQALLARSSSLRPNVRYQEFLAASLTPRATENRKKFWTRYLNDATLLHLPQPEKDGSQKRVEIIKPALFSDVGELERLAREERLSTQAVVFATYAKIYAGRASQVNNEGEDVVLGIYLANRSHLSDLDKLTAPTLNLVPLLVRSPIEISVLELAKHIQTDLQLIGTAESSAVTLREIYEWTGVRVDTFVNYLKLPGVGERDGKEGDNVLKALDERRVAERHEVVMAEEGKVFELPEELKELKGGDAYQHSIDIEMTINNGQLNVGFFGPEAMVGLEGAENALAELKRTLGRLVGKEKASGA